MKRNPNSKLSAIENDVIAEIRALKASSPVGFNAALLESPARITHHFILASHGNVHLRLTTIARELGMEMRTLERLFFAEYKRTMAQCQIEARVAFSKWLLSIFPPTKISSVASSVGYSQVQDFNRFFKKHVLQSPSAWSQKERARIAREQDRRSRNP